MFERLRTGIADLWPAKLSGPTASIRVRYFRTADSEMVRQILRESNLSGAESPLHQITMTEFMKPRAIASYSMSILGFVLGARSSSLLMQCISAALISSGFISIAFSVKVRLRFIKFVDEGLADDVSAIPRHYEMVCANKDGDALVPVGKNAFWVAEAYGLDGPKETEIVGCIGIDATTSSATELRRMAVASKYRGRGVAKMLVKTLIGHARAHDIDSIFLRMSAANMNALAVYERFGWVVTDRNNWYKNVKGYLLDLKVSECSL